MFSSSISNIETRITNGIQDKYLKVGQAIAVRKFDDTLFPSSSWNEIWIAYRWRMEPAYNYKIASSATYNFGGDVRAMFGVCDTSGFVYGDSGSLATRNYLKHYAGFQLDSGLSYNFPLWNHYESSSISQSAFNTMVSPDVFVSGSNTQGGNSDAISKAKITIMPFSEPSSSRNVFIMRMATGSSATTWSLSILYPKAIGTTKVTSSAFHTDVSGSFRLADFMTASNWNVLTKSVETLMPSGSYGIVDFTDSMYINRPLNGYFDGVFITWQQRFDFINLSDIVVRMI